VTAPAVPGRRRFAGLLHERDFRLFWFGQTTSRFGSTITAVALPLIAVTVLDASTLNVALLQAATWTPWLLIGLPAGAWVDRLPRRPVMLACDAASLLLFLSIPVAAWLHALTMGHLLGVALGAGTAAVFFEAAYQVYLPSLVPARQLAEGNAKLQGSEAAAQVCGPGAGGLLTHSFGAVAGVLADALTFAVSAVCLLALRHREPQRASPPPRRALLREISEGLGFLIRDPYLRVLAVFGAVSNLALMGYQTILIVFLVRELDVSPGATGGIIAAMSSGGLLGAVMAAPLARHVGTAHAMLLASLGAAPFALLIPLAAPGPGLALVVIGGVVVGAGVVAGNIIKGSFRQLYTPRHLLGRVLTGMQLLNYGTIPAGALLAGALGTVLGLRPALWIMTAGLVVASGVLLVGPIRRHRDLPTFTAPVHEETATPVDVGS
jgi:MFS family permease